MEAVGDFDAGVLTFRSNDGRVVSYLDQGESSARPVMFFEGTPGHTRFRDSQVAVARDCDVRLVTLHRPGYHLSTPRPHYRLTDLASDAAALADHLGIDRFPIVGHSAGGPPALACAHELPDRVTRIAVSGGNAPFGFDGDTFGMAKDVAFLFRIARRVPRIVAPIMRSVGRKVAKDPAASVASALESAPPSEHEYYSRPEVTACVVAASAAQAAAGMAGMAADFEAALRPWGFELGDLTVPVDLWYGEEDASKIRHGRRLAELIPHATTNFAPNEAHEIVFTHLREVLTDVLDTTAPAA